MRSCQQMAVTHFPRCCISVSLYTTDRVLTQFISIRKQDWHTWLYCFRYKHVTFVNIGCTCIQGNVSTYVNFIAIYPWRVMSRSNTTEWIQNEDASTRLVLSQKLVLSILKYTFRENLVHKNTSLPVKSGYRFFEFKTFQSAQFCSVGLITLRWVFSLSV